MSELINKFAQLPWYYWVCLGGMFSLAIANHFVVRRVYQDVKWTWYNKWEKRIRQDLRNVRKTTKRKDREYAYRGAFGKMWEDLYLDTGNNMHKLNTGELSVWIMLATAQRDTMRPYC